MDHNIHGTARAWYQRYLLFFSIPFLTISGFAFRQMIRFFSEYGFWELLFLFVVGAVFLVLGSILLHNILRISVDEQGVTLWRLFRRRRILWTEVREIGVACFPHRFGYGMHPEQWRDQALFYVSPRPLTDAERVGYADCREWIAFPYCKELRPTNARDQRMRDAMVRYYPGSLPSAFHGLRQIVYPAYTVRSEQPDGTFTETSGEIPNPDEVYYSLRNAG